MGFLGEKERAMRLEGSLKRRIVVREFCFEKEERHIKKKGGGNLSAIDGVRRGVIMKPEGPGAPFPYKKGEGKKSNKKRKKKEKEWRGPDF